MRSEFIIERQGKKAVLYAGLLAEAHEQGLWSIETQLLQAPSAENGNVAICFARVTMPAPDEDGVIGDKPVTLTGGTRTFTGIGDASPDNVAPMLRPHIIRMAETRAKARALRDAVNVGMVSLEELGSDDVPDPPAYERSQAAAPPRRSNEPPHPAELQDTEGAEPRALGPRSATEKQLKAVYAIAHSSLGLSNSEVDAKCKDIYGYAPQELSRWEASQFIDLLKQDKVG